VKVSKVKWTRVSHSVRYAPHVHFTHLHTVLLSYLPCLLQSVAARTVKRHTQFGGKSEHATDSRISRRIYMQSHAMGPDANILVYFSVHKLLLSSCWPLAVKPRDERGRRQVRPVVKRAVARAWQQRELC